MKSSNGYSNTTSTWCNIYLKSRSKGHARSTVMNSTVNSHVTTRTPVSSARTKQELYKHTTHYSCFFIIEIKDLKTPLSTTCYRLSHSQMVFRSTYHGRRNWSDWYKNSGRLSFIAVFRVAVKARKETFSAINVSAEKIRLEINVLFCFILVLFSLPFRHFIFRTDE